MATFGRDFLRLGQDSEPASVLMRDFHIGNVELRDPVTFVLWESNGW